MNTMYAKMQDNESLATVKGPETEMVEHHVAPNVPPPTAPPHTIPTWALKVQPLLGPNHTVVQCPSCLQKVRTLTETTVTTRTHVLALKCCIFCCCCLPYCMDSAKNTDHFCPSCKAYLGTYKK